jgi:hypothetical protein
MQDLPDDVYYCPNCKYLHRDSSHKPVHIPGVHFITDPLTVRFIALNNLKFVLNLNVLSLALVLLLSVLNKVSKYQYFNQAVKASPRITCVAQRGRTPGRVPACLRLVAKKYLTRLQQLENFKVVVTVKN